MIGSREVGTIRTDDEAFVALRELLESSDKRSFRFENWPRVDIELTGSKFHGTLTSGAMIGLIDLQQAINRSYAILRYDDSSQRLTEEEKGKLELVVKVENGSSEIDISLTDALTTIAQGIANMDPTHMTIILISVGLIWAGRSVFEKFLDGRKEIRLKELSNQDGAANKEVRMAELQVLKFSSEQDVERMRIMAKAMDLEPALRSVERVSRDAMMSIVKVASKADSAVIQGVELTGGQAAELKVGARNSRTAEILTGRYRVRAVDSSRSEFHRVTLESSSDQSSIKVDVPIDAESKRTRDLIREAEWERFEIELIIEVDHIADRTEGVAILKADRAGTAN